MAEFEYVIKDRDGKEVRRETTTHPSLAPTVRDGEQAHPVKPAEVQEEAVRLANEVPATVPAEGEAEAEAEGENGGRKRGSRRS